MQSRKHDSITDDDVACLLAPGHAELGEQERFAIEFLDRLSADHHAIDAKFYARLGRVFSGGADRRLGFQLRRRPWACRFLHTLDLFGTAAPAIPYARDEVDAAR